MKSNFEQGMGLACELSLWLLWIVALFGAGLLVAYAFRVIVWMLGGVRELAVIGWKRCWSGRRGPAKTHEGTENGKNCEVSPACVVGGEQLERVLAHERVSVTYDENGRIVRSDVAYREVWA